MVWCVLPTSWRVLPPPRTAPAHAVEAIVALREFGGSSAYAIESWLRRNRPGLQFTRQRLSQRLLACAQQGVLVRVKNSFKVRWRLRSSGSHVCMAKVHVNVYELRLVCVGHSPHEPQIFIGATSVCLPFSCHQSMPWLPRTPRRQSGARASPNPTGRRPQQGVGVVLGRPVPALHCPLRGQGRRRGRAVQAALKVGCWESF